MDITQENFNNGVDNNGDPIPNGTALTVHMENGTQVSIVFYDDNPTEPNDSERIITLVEFRNFLDTGKNKLDRLRDHIEDDAIFLSICTNLTAGVLPVHREYVRGLLADFYVAVNGVDVHKTQTIDGLNYLVSIGALTQDEIDPILSIV